MHRRSQVAAGLAVAGALLAAAVPASGSVVSIENGGGTLSIRADTDPVNDLKVGLVPGNLADYRITDSASPINNPLPAQCLRETLSSVRCPSASVTFINVFLSNGGDTFAPLEPAGIPEGTRLSVKGSNGSDNITGRASAGNDSLFGNDGNDALTVPCPDTVGKLANGGPGNDRITICGVTSTSSFVALTAPALASAAGAGAVGEGGNDILVGGPGDNALNGGPGKDRLTGKGGKDRLLCGGGKDVASGGGGKDVAKGCEKAKSA